MSPAPMYIIMLTKKLLQNFCVKIPVIFLSLSHFESEVRSKKKKKHFQRILILEILIQYGIKKIYIYDNRNITANKDDTDTVGDRCVVKTTDTS